MIRYYMWDSEGYMYCVDSDDRRIRQVEQLQDGRLSRFDYGGVTMVRALGVVA